MAIHISGPEKPAMKIGSVCVSGRDGQNGISPVFSVGTVETLPAGSEATVELTGTQAAPVLNFGIPKGRDGSGTVIAVNNRTPDGNGNVFIGSNNIGVDSPVSWLMPAASVNSALNMLANGKQDTIADLLTIRSRAGASVMFKTVIEIAEDDWTQEKTASFTSAAALPYLTADSAVWVSPVPADIEKWKAAEIYCVSAGNNSVTFKYFGTAPEDAVSVNIAWRETV